MHVIFRSIQTFRYWYFCTVHSRCMFFFRLFAARISMGWKYIKTNSNKYCRLSMIFIAFSSITFQLIRYLFHICSCLGYTVYVRVLLYYPRYDHDNVRYAYNYFLLEFVFIFKIILDFFVFIFDNFFLDSGYL